MTAVHDEPVTHPNRIINAVEAATTIGVDTKTMYSWRARRKGPPSFKVLGKVVYDQAQLLEWLARQREGSTRGDSA